MKEQFQDYLFHFNPYKGMWFAFKREDMNDYFNDVNNTNVLTARNVKDLISRISLGE